MSEMKSILTAISEAEDHSLKTRLCEYLHQYLNANKPDASDRDALKTFVLGELNALLRAIPAAPNYKAQDAMMAYEDQLMGLLMLACPDPRKLSPEEVETVRAIMGLLEEIQFFENAVNKLFQQETVYPTYVEQLVNTHKQLTDEYHRGQLYNGLLHYKDKLGGFSHECKAILSDHVAAEVARYLSGDLTEDVLANLEYIADVAKYLQGDALLEQVYATLQLGNNTINFYAAETLLSAGKDVPADVVTALAEDLANACLIYPVLQKYGKEGMFPSELANEEYLAKSDLVRWLTYPTELGKKPDEIEYIGRTTVKKEDYFLFRYKSDSDNLGDELKNKWLIGWSGSDGGTFSQFDEYALYEQATPEKTVKYIKRKLL